MAATIVMTFPLGNIDRSPSSFSLIIDDNNDDNSNKNNSLIAQGQETNVQLNLSHPCDKLPQQQRQQSSIVSSLPKVKDSTLRVELVADGLSNTTSMAFVDRCTILALQKNDGKVIMITTANSNETTVQTMPILQLKVENASERGLLGITVANESDTTSSEPKKVFLYFTENVNGEVRNRVYIYDWTGKNLTNSKLILDLPATPGPNHDSGKMAIGKDGSLYAVIGNLNRKGMLQNIANGPQPDDAGVIFRVNPDDGSAVKGNPFISSSSSQSAVINVTEQRLDRYFAYGIRNSFGLAIDPVTGNLWETENGVDKYDELNLVIPGFNSGWQQVMGPLSRDNKTTSHDLVVLPNSHYADPIFSWKATVAPTDIEFLRSTKLGAKYANNIFVGDFLNGNLYYFELNAKRTGLKLVGTGLADGVADNKDELSTVIFATGFAGGVTDIQTGPDGYPYILTFAGDLYRIVPAEGAATMTAITSRVNTPSPIAVNQTTSTNTGLAELPVVPPPVIRLPEDDLPSALTDPDLKIETVASGLYHPTAMAFLGSSNDILVTEKDNGTIRRVIDGRVLPEPVLNVAVANDNVTNERGLLGMAVAKVNETKTYVLLYFTESGDGQTGSDANGVLPAGNRLYRYELVEGEENGTMKLTNPKLLLDLPARPGPRYEGGKLLVRQEQTNSSSNIAIGSNATITSTTPAVYLQIGFLDKTSSQETTAENNKAGPPPDGTGGILRVDIEGNPLPNPPLVSNNSSSAGDITGGMLRYYFAYGIRNGFGMDFDPVTSKLWDTENGPTYGDEINLVEPGFNSGFNKIKGGLASMPENQRIVINRDLENFGGLGRYSDPKFVWQTPVGVTAIKFLNSTKLGEQYENDMFVGDVNNGRIYHFEPNENRTDLLLNGMLADRVANNAIELKSAIFGTGFRNISDIEVGPDGYLYILQFSSGKIVRIVPG